MIVYYFDEKLPARRDLNSKNCERWRSRGVSASRSPSKCERCPPLEIDITDHHYLMVSHHYHYHQHHHMIAPLQSVNEALPWSLTWPLSPSYHYHYNIIIALTITGNHMDVIIIQRCANLDFSLCPMPAPWPTLVAGACVVTRNILVEYFCCGKYFGTCKCSKIEIFQSSLMFWLG